MVGRPRKFLEPKIFELVATNQSSKKLTKVMQSELQLGETNKS